ncbi:hypothetical protein NE237_023607 [Protea cynaroides]|uniref:Epidermal patterning factor-like protein n=1 Tax=Protea cynaroides TaxID=273540 RepID=A0A9Q0HFB2_9MAGN|nr:hypothetical protein NE237_023607 [Protea cynaroides]
MKFFSPFVAYTAFFLAAILLGFPTTSRSIRVALPDKTAVSFKSQPGSTSGTSKEKLEELGMEMSFPTGSSLPDCSHACGPCSPCKRVMVSFDCSNSAESCPIVYRFTTSQLQTPEKSVFIMENHNLAGECVYAVIQQLKFMGASPRT